MRIRWVMTIFLALFATASVSSAEGEDETAPEEATSEEATTEESPEASAEVEAMRNRLAEASEAACNHAVSCAMEGVPESVRGMIDRSQICRMYERYEAISVAEYDRQCANAALAYFACIENTSCQEFSDGRGANFCGAEGEEARKQCDSD